MASILFAFSVSLLLFASVPGIGGTTRERIQRIIQWTNRENCGIVEEKSSYQITQRLNQTYQNVTWQRREGQGWVDVTTCSLGSGFPCTNHMESSYTATITSGDEGSTYYQLKILQVARNDTNFRCLGDGTQLRLCDLEVYVKPSEPAWAKPGIVKEGNGTFWAATCYSENVYPKGKCQMQYRGLPKDSNVSVTVNVTIATGNPQNFRLECQLKLELKNMSPGTYSLAVDVTMSPQLSTEVDNATVQTTWKRDFKLKNPVVELASDCPSGPHVAQGYIKDGTNASCLCELKVPGIPPGQAQWFNYKGDKIGTVSSANGSATIIFKNEGFPKKCKAQTVLKQSTPSQVPYTPSYAHGPSESGLDLYLANVTSQAYDLCPSKNSSVQVLCTSKGYSVPDVLFLLVVNSAVVINETERRWPRGNLMTVKYYFSLKVRKNSVRCKAVNSIFKEITYEKELNFEVREPPSKAPLLRIFDNQLVQGNGTAIISNRTSSMEMTCSVEGGYPAVTDVTITCGDKTFTQVGNTISVKIKFPEDQKTLECRCSAQHISGCYTNNQTLLTVHAEPVSVNEGKTKSDKSVNITLIVGLSVAVSLIILVAVVAVTVCWKKGIIRPSNTRRRGTPANPYIQIIDSSGSSTDSASYSLQDNGIANVDPSDMDIYDVIDDGPYIEVIDSSEIYATDTPPALPES